MEYDFLKALYSIIIILLIYLLIIKKKLIHFNIVKSDAINEIDFENNEFEYVYITNEETLLFNSNKIKQLDINYLAIDTEFNKGKTFYGNLCLMQISYKYKEKTTNIILDVILLKKDLLIKYVKPILENKDIIKVAHAAYNDKDWIYEHFSAETYPIFDTQEVYEKIVKKVGNLKDNNQHTSTINNRNKKVGLDYLLGNYLNIRLTKDLKKKYQLLNWKHRPLKKDMLNYASFDTKYLIDLANILKSHYNSMFNKELNIFELKINQSDFKKDPIKRLEQRAEAFYINNNYTYKEGIFELYTDIFNIIAEEAKKKDISIDLYFPFKLIFKICSKLPTNKEEFKNVLNNFNVKFDLESNNTVNSILNLIELHKNREYKSDILIDSNTTYKNNTEKSKAKELRKKNFIKKYTRNNPVYENCVMFAPTGQQLCFCDTKKMNWYLSKNLATKISENEFILNFKPNQTGCIDQDLEESNFYITAKKNCCVVCGVDYNYLKFHVVPYIYRQHFPNILKAHKSHDIVLLCLECHEKANKLYNKEKENIAIKYNVSSNIQSIKTLGIKKLNKIINISKNLIKKKPYIDNNKIKEIEDELKKLIIENHDDNYISGFYKYLFDNSALNKDNITCDFKIDNKLLYLINNFKIKNLKNSETIKNQHGFEVVKKLSDITVFIKHWRRFFLNNMNPRYLPSSWKIEHQVVRTFGDHSAFKTKIKD